MIRGFLAGLCVLAATLGFGQSGEVLPGPILTWEEKRYDFGDVVQGDRVEHTFRFTNTGTAALLITNVEVSCGCTTPKGWTRDPIQPGERSELTIAFDSAGKNGKQIKVVTVVSNSVAVDNKITFTANVLPKVPPQP
ncbi:MAG: DUF1573 domain-containing protein [Cyclobacteriaceae bacterium]|jgi:hypothetical protein